jgi:C1A family cysteine protease
MPLSGETSQGGHAICLVGYSDDTKLPGGGVFIFKNSWGTSWSFDNILNRQGFGLISYKYIETYCNQAFLTI